VEGLRSTYSREVRSFGSIYSGHYSSQLVMWCRNSVTVRRERSRNSRSAKRDAGPAEARTYQDD
jgi:hypothetical protein